MAHIAKSLGHVSHFPYQTPILCRTCTPSTPCTLVHRHRHHNHSAGTASRKRTPCHAQPCPICNVLSFDWWLKQINDAMEQLFTCAKHTVCAILFYILLFFSLLWTSAVWLIVWCFVQGQLKIKINKQNKYKRVRELLIYIDGNDRTHREKFV